MPQFQLTQIGKHKIKLSNLDKVLFPEAHVIKAEVIQYYHQMTPVILRHIKHRPLSFIRYPDGIYGEHFYQKNKQEWAPQWIQSVQIGKGEKKIDYVIATDEAVLVWLANLACIEFHQSSVQNPNLTTPDHFVFDLDPPETMNFNRIREIAISMGDHLRGYGYHPFVKTSGKKGIHVFVPIHRKWDYDTLKVTLKSLSEGFVKKHSKDCTTNIRKEARTDKLFVDIVRNNLSQTVVCPYSLRATPECTVSMPLTWEELEELKSPKEFTIHNVPAKVKQDGDAWEGFGSKAVGLHDQESGKAASAQNPALREYVEKRDFQQTPEPTPGAREGTDDAFVIHRHDATRLHYDLRLSDNGVLRSWAVPKGLPPAPGIKRLAVETEPHPMEYLDFEGEIPKGHYGAGDIWIFARGNYRITKQKKDGFYFKLESPTIDQEFRIHHMKDKDWLLERVDPPEIDVTHAQIEHMLTATASKVPIGDYIYEMKWDGIRTMVYVDEEDLRLCSRGKRDITKQFPELLKDRKQLKCTQAILDGEIVVLDAQGKPQFKTTVGRMHKSNEHNIRTAMNAAPAYCYLFDVLYLDGCVVQKEPLHKRKAWLKSLIKPGGHFRYSEDMEDGNALFEATKKMGLEGIIAKRRDSIYLPGKRTEQWVKIKHRNDMTCRIIGYTEGQGDRRPYFGALHLADAESENLIYLGKVGTGFNEKLMAEITTELKKLKEIRKPIKERLEDEKQTTWVEPLLYCDVQYASVTPNGTLREPVFLYLREE
ncbi:MAG TPA: non-homologous end-joining DNA ligase [Saprospiraceae bacterium]|nr:non-homologous end-joining DNA ligase [Saprospiraceae bacterium]